MPKHTPTSQPSLSPSPSPLSPLLDTTLTNVLIAANALAESLTDPASIGAPTSATSAVPDWTSSSATDFQLMLCPYARPP